MTPEQVTIQLTAHEHEIGSLKHRTKRVESQVEAINRLTVSVNTLAGSVRDLLEVQKSQNDRLCRLELAPAREARDAKREIARAIAGALSGALVGAVITALSQGLW